MNLGWASGRVGNMPEEFRVEGVRVETYGEPSSRPPMLLVHGGAHGSWVWERFAPVLAAGGWEVACLNWFGHHGSVELPRPEAVSRSILDVRREIGIVAGRLGRTPILVGHSMGGLACLAYAARRPVAALVLITPVVPRGFADAPIPLPADPDALFRPPDDQADMLFWDQVGADDAARYRRLLTPESPRAVLEATRWWCDVDLDAIRAPSWLVASTADLLVPHAAVESLAHRLGAPCLTLDGRGGHGVPLNPIGREVADQAMRWCDAALPDGA